jgi:uncharacterized phage protein (TIGR01671 family)
MNKREIKFRAWVTQTFLAPFVNESYMAVQGDPDIETLKSFMHHYGDEEKLMQYTGLKDKNGKEIYEGDVVHFFRFLADKSGFIGEVYFENGQFLLRPSITIIDCRLSDHDCEVIGNIFENPELLSK